MKADFSGWILFILLSVIWGSSFILMKLGMQALTAIQVASIRISGAAIVLLPFAKRAYNNIPKQKRVIVLIAGLLGSFFPAYLYCLAETRIDSSLAAILNSLTPLLTIVIGLLFFRIAFNVYKLTGVLIGLTGLILLPFAAHESISFDDLSYSALVLVATLCYASNVNIVSRYLQQTAALDITALAFTFLLFPALIILAGSGFFQLTLTQAKYLQPLLASLVLGVIGTAIATILFYTLVKKQGPLFASMVTYGIPIIAVVWGVIFREKVTIAEIGCLLIILAGVYMVNKK